MTLELINSLYPVEAEQSVIGSILQESHLLDEIAPLISEQDFSQESHQWIWKAIMYQWNNNKPVDAITVGQMLITYKRVYETGGMSYLLELQSSVPSTASVKHYVNIIRSKAARRRTIKAAEEMKRLAVESEDDEILFSEVEKTVADVRPGKSDKMISIKDAREDFFKFLETKDDFILTGFKKFDDWMGGLGRGWLYILAGRPSAGKTAKALQMAVGIAQSGAGVVPIWSQEMTRNQVLARMSSTKSEVNSGRIRRKLLDSQEMLKLKQAYDELEKLPMFINDAAGVTIEEIRAEARALKRQHGALGAIVIDYLGIMKIPQEKGQTRAQAIGQVTRTAKQMAKELECPVIMLAQMSRAGAASEEPMLEHLKESGDIEQDADIVEFVYESDETDPNGKIVISKIAKGRDVGVNKFTYLFKGWLQRFEDYNT